jgi:hypothetical protein
MQISDVLVVIAGLWVLKMGYDSMKAVSYQRDQLLKRKSEIGYKVLWGDENAKVAFAKEFQDEKMFPSTW